MVLIKKLILRNKLEYWAMFLKKEYLSSSDLREVELRKCFSLVFNFAKYGSLMHYFLFSVI